MLHNFSTSFNQSDTIDGKIPTLFLKKKKLYIYQMVFQKKERKMLKYFFVFLKNQVHLKLNINYNNIQQV